MRVELGPRSAAYAGFRETDENYMERLKLSLCALIGVLLTVLVAVVVFPIRARTMLRKRTAKLLERMGNLAFYLMGEFCEASLSRHATQNRHLSACAACETLQTAQVCKIWRLRGIWH